MKMSVGVLMCTGSVTRKISLAQTVPETTNVRNFLRVEFSRSAYVFVIDFPKEDHVQS